MKKCPYCAEEIQDEAIFCRFCKRDLRPASDVSSQPATPRHQEVRAPGVSIARVIARTCHLGALIWTALCFFWVVGTAVGVSRMDTGGSSAASAGAAIGMGLGVVFIGGAWFIGVVVLELVALVSSHLGRSIPESRETSRREWGIAFLLASPVALLVLIGGVGSLVPKSSPGTNSTPTTASPTSDFAVPPSGPFRVTRSDTGLVVDNVTPGLYGGCVISIAGATSEKEDVNGWGKRSLLQSKFDRADTLYPGAFLREAITITCDRAPSGSAFSRTYRP